MHWWAFLAFGVALHGVAWAADWILLKDLAKMLLWWCTLAWAFAWSLASWKPQSLRWTWPVLAGWWSLDIAIQGLIRGYFGAAPEPSVLVETLSHSNMAESWGFTQGRASSIALGLGFALAMTVCAYVLARRLPLPKRPKKWGWVLGALLLVLTLAIHRNPTMLRQEPFLRWAVLYQRYRDAQAEIAHMQQLRAAVQKQHAQWQVQRLIQMPRTVVVLLGESSTRNNWSHYAYARPTTLTLENTLAQLPGRTLWLDHAWSAEAFTLQSLRLAFTPATKETPDLWRSTPDMLQLAKAAGYRVTWLSNQPGAEGWFAAMAAQADKRRFINHGNWRDSSSIDADLLPVLQQELQAPAATYEFIVLHLLGQHFHYQQRCPDGLMPFPPTEDDAVIKAMQQAGRSQSTIAARNAYDNALYCGADMLAKAVRMIDSFRPKRSLQVLYFSDHGQEVGQNRDFAGHSQQDATGYAIPFWWWSRDALPLPADTGQKPFRLDALPHALQHVLGMTSVYYDAKADVFSPSYAPSVSAEPVLAK